MMYSTSSHDVQWQWSGPPPPYILYLLSHLTQGMAPGVLRFWRCTDGSPHSGCFCTVWTLQTPQSPLFVFVFVNWINVSSTNPKFTCYVFSVLINDTIANIMSLSAYHHCPHHLIISIMSLPELIIPSTPLFHFYEMWKLRILPNF